MQSPYFGRWILVSITTKDNKIMYKNFKYLLLGSLFLPMFSYGVNVNLSGVAPNLNDSGGSPVPDDRLALLIVDTGTMGASSSVVLSSGTLTPGAFLGTSDDYLVATGSVQFDSFLGSPTYSFSSVNANDPALADGDYFYVAWFPTVVDSATSLSGGESYGLTRASDWELPASGSVTGSSAPGGNANLTVVPEPQSFAMVAGILGLGLALIRRRR